VLDQKLDEEQSRLDLPEGTQTTGQAHNSNEPREGDDMTTRSDNIFDIYSKAYERQKQSVM